MPKNVRITKVIKHNSAIEGDGIHHHQAFGNSETPHYDPFLLLDIFRSAELRYFLKGFSLPSHQDIETITYVLPGDVESGDGTDDSGVIGDGDAPRMSAGGGRYHLKMPKVDSNGYTHGLQLWANLPASYKMRLPRYRSILDKEIPSVGVSGGATVKVIAGKVGGAIGPVHDAEYLDVTIPPHSEFIHRTMSDHIVFAYIIKGRGFFCKEKHSFSDEGEGANHLDIREDPFVDHATLVLFDDGDQVIVSTEINPVRFFLVSGKSMREPAAWYGPVVMNTREEFQGAF